MQSCKELKSQKRLQSIRRKQMMSMRFWKNCLLIGLAFAVIHFWLKTKSYIFDKKEVIRIAQKYADQDIQQAFKKITSDLQNLYPGHVLGEHHREWVMTKFSGMAVSMTILHSSITEYMVFIGTGLDTDGYIGRHWTNTTFVVLSGSMNFWKEGTFHATEYRAGDTFTRLSGTTGFVGWKANTWALAFGRGFVPASLPASIADMTFTSFDFIGILKIFKAFTVASYYEMKNEIASFISSI